MSDSRDFQDAESVHSGQSHVTSQPAFFPPFQNPGGMLSRSLGMPSRNDGPPSIWDTHGTSGNVSANRNTRCGSFEIESSDGTKIISCHMVCWSTLYQLCIPGLDKTAATVAKCIAERWIQYLGPPMLIIADQGKEFVGTQFKEFTNANSILLHTIDVRAPWQNGPTERHGDIYKKIFERARCVSDERP